MSKPAKRTNTLNGPILIHNKRETPTDPRVSLWNITPQQSTTHILVGPCSRKLLKPLAFNLAKGFSRILGSDHVVVILTDMDRDFLFPDTVYHEWIVDDLLEVVKRRFQKTFNIQSLKKHLYDRMAAKPGSESFGSAHFPLTDSSEFVLIYLETAHHQPLWVQRNYAVNFCPQYNRIRRTGDDTPSIWNQGRLALLLHEASHHICGYGSLRELNSDIMALKSLQHLGIDYPIPAMRAVTILARDKSSLVESTYIMTSFLDHDTHPDYNQTYWPTSQDILESVAFIKLRLQKAGLLVYNPSGNSIKDPFSGGLSLYEMFSPDPLPFGQQGLAGLQGPEDPYLIALVRKLAELHLQGAFWESHWANILVSNLVRGMVIGQRFDPSDQHFEVAFRGGESDDFRVQYPPPPHIASPSVPRTNTVMLAP